MMSLPGPPTRAEIFDNSGCLNVQAFILNLNETLKNGRKTVWPMLHQAVTYLRLIVQESGAS